MQRCRILNIFVYSDESGVLDKVHNSTYVFGGLVFLSKNDKDLACRKYSAAESCVRKNGGYSLEAEVKASNVKHKEKYSLYRATNRFYKFGAIINQDRVLDSIMQNKKSKQRFLDYVYKIGLKRLLEKLIRERIINPSEVENIYLYVDEHTTATNGIYELRETIEEEFKVGMYNWNFRIFHPPLFPNLKGISLQYCNSATVTLVRAADVVANHIYHDALAGKTYDNTDFEQRNIVVSYFP